MTVLGIKKNILYRNEISKEAMIIIGKSMVFIDLTPVKKNKNLVIAFFVVNK